MNDAVNRMRNLQIRYDAALKRHSGNISLYQSYCLNRDEVRIAEYHQRIMESMTELMSLVRESCELMIQNSSNDPIDELMNLLNVGSDKKSIQ